MRQIRVEKITLNIGTGKPGDDLDKAVKLLTKISGAKAVETISHKRIPTWGVRPGLAIGTKVTLRKEKAVKLLKDLLKSRDNKLSIRCFDDKGNLSFGIKEYLDIPGVKYDASIGIIGLEVAVTLTRPGFRIKNRSIKTKTLPKSHKITKEESIEFMEKEFNVQVEGKE